MICFSNEVITEAKSGSERGLAVRKRSLNCCLKVKHIFYHGHGLKSQDLAAVMYTFRIYELKQVLI